MPIAAIGIGLGTAIAGGAAAGATVYAANRSSRSAREGARYQTNAANYAADLEAKAAEQTLAFAKEQEAARRAEFEKTQLRNREIYDAEQMRDQSRYTDLHSRLAPYRQFGAGSLGQLMRPIPQPGSLGARIGG